MEKVSQPASAVIATNIIVAIMVTYSLSIYCAEALIDVCRRGWREKPVNIHTILTKALDVVEWGAMN